MSKEFTKFHGEFFSWTLLHSWIDQMSWDQIMTLLDDNQYYLLWEIAIILKKAKCWESFSSIWLLTKKHTGPCLHFNKFWYLMKASLLQQYKWSWMKQKELSVTVPKAVLCPDKVYIGFFFMVGLKGSPLLWTSFCVPNNLLEQLLLIKPNEGNTWSSRIKRKQIIFYWDKSMFLWCSIWKFSFI